MVYGQPLYGQSSTQKHELGAKRVLPDGRVFVYAQAGASALVAGKLLQSAAPAANHLNKLVKATGTVGDKKVTVAIGATALTADQYAEGFLHINDAAGEANAYKVKGHAAYSASGAACVIALEDELRVALTASTSEYTLTKHPQDTLILCPTTQTASVAGVSPIAVTAAYYFWMQVKGPAPLLTDGVVVIGNGVVPSAGASGVAGAVIAEAAGSVTERVGTVMQVNATTEYSLINLAIPGY